MIRLGDIELHAIPAKGGDEGWSEHWEIRKRRRVIGYAVSLMGAVRIAVSQKALDQDLGRRGVATYEAAVRELIEACQHALPDPASGGVSGKEAT